MREHTSRATHMRESRSRSLQLQTVRRASRAARAREMRDLSSERHLARRSRLRSRADISSGQDAEPSRVEAARKCALGQSSPWCWRLARRHEPQRVRAQPHLASSRRPSRLTTSLCHRPRTTGSRGCASIGTCGLHAKASYFATSRIGWVCITDERRGEIHERVMCASRSA